MCISQQKDFNVFVNKSTLYRLNLNTVEYVIDCQKAEEVFEDEEYQGYKEHMKSIRKDIFSSPDKNENVTKHGFQSAIGRLTRKLHRNKRLFCRNGDQYLVKKSFTEGIQRVPEGVIHTYAPKGRPLDIFISNIPLEIKTFKDYDYCTTPKRILPGETADIPPNTFYAVIAPCHTVFTKKIIKVENSMMPSIKTESVYEIKDVTENRNGCSSTEYDDRESKRVKSSTHEPRPSTSQVASAAENNNGYSSSKQTNELFRTSPSPQPSGSRDDEHNNSRRSLKFEGFDVSEMVNDESSFVSKRPSMEHDRESKRVKSSTHEPRPSTSGLEVAVIPPSPNSLRSQIELMSSIGTSGDDHNRAVFAIRKDSEIESYSLRPGSSFKIYDNILTGSFAIENEDMDPHIIEYHGEVQFIREVATFKNGSTFKTTLSVQKDLLDELRDTQKKKEKVVVNYFFEFAFKAIAAAYKRFSEMRNTKMIGSCVPAIVPLGDSRFVGVVSDTYEGKP